MRAGLSTIQQTLTAEAVSVLKQSIAEAGRRSHGQTTPLHVAASLLGSSSGFLRQACIKSHPNSSHPLQCRALELCFSVALERLPSTQGDTEPPISNALMAALKRAQAHQRRGCPEQQQQPLLAVKVELEHLVISILDDPSVSRVMREASFSSPAVKATIEHSAFRPGVSKNLYLNPRLHQAGDEARRVIDILLRTNKRNPVLVGDPQPEAVMKEVLRRIQTREFGQAQLLNVEVIHLDTHLVTDTPQIALKIKQLGAVVDEKIGNSIGGVILHLGDLKWLVEAGRPAVVEMGELLARFRDTVWLTGTATCETYLRCQVYYSSLEVDWDLQAVSITPRAHMPGLFPRIGGNGILSSSVDALSPLKGFTIAPTAPLNLDPTQTTSCCPKCMQNYEQEVEKFWTKDFERASSQVRSDSSKPSLPQWLQNAKPHDCNGNTTDLLQDQELAWKHKTEELKKKWTEICIQQHNFSSDLIASATLSATNLNNSNLLGRQPFQPKFQLNTTLGDMLKLNPGLVPSRLSSRAATPPGSPVRTELVLGNSKISQVTLENSHKEQTKDFLGCISTERENKIHEMQSDKLGIALDTDSYKKLLKGLLEKVWWQQEAASAVAATVTKCKMGNGKQRNGGSKGDTWLLFIGPDRIGKKKMAAALADMSRGTNPIIISLGSQRNDRESGLDIRGKTVLDRIGDAIRRNPFSVVMLEDIDEAELLFRGSIKWAIERGRLADSNGREISLANAMFIVTASYLPDDLRFMSNGVSLDEEKLARLAGGNWQLRLSVGGKTMKRRGNWVQDGERAMKPRTEAGSGFSFDLNEAGDAEDDSRASRNSSDLTVDHEEDHNLDIRESLAAAGKELANHVDDAIVFKPVDFGPIRRDIANTVTKKFSAIMGEGLVIEVEDEALEKIMSGVWLGETGVEEWTEKVLVPSFNHLKARLHSGEPIAVRLEPDCDSDSPSMRYGEWLPSNVKVVAARHTHKEM